MLAGQVDLIRVLDANDIGAEHPELIRDHVTQRRVPHTRPVCAARAPRHRCSPFGPTQTLSSKIHRIARGMKVKRQRLARPASSQHRPTATSSPASDTGPRSSTTPPSRRSPSTYAQPRTWSRRSNEQRPKRRSIPSSPGPRQNPPHRTSVRCRRGDTHHEYTPTLVSNARSRMMLGTGTPNA